MTIAASVEAVLAADATLIAALTGGIYTYQELKKLGLNITTTPGAFDATTRKIKPCAVVKQRSRVPTSAIKDQALQLTSEAAVIEIYLYSDGNASPPESSADRIYVLLQERQVGAGTLQMINQLDDFRDPELDYANTIRMDFLYEGIRS